MAPYILITFFPAIINLGLCVYVWSRNPDARENRLLALGCLGLSVYCFRTFEVNTRPLEFAEVVFPALTFGPLLAGAALSDFLMTIAKRPLLARRSLAIAVIYIPIVFFSIGEITTDWFYIGIEVTEDGRYSPQGGLYHPIPNYFLLCLLLLGLVKSLLAAFSSKEYKHRKQLIWSVSGIGIAVLFILALLHLPESIIPLRICQEITD